MTTVHEDTSKKTRTLAATVALGSLALAAATPVAPALVPLVVALTFAALAGLEAAIDHDHHTA